MRGLSESVGILLVLLILTGTIIPLVMILISQPTRQEQQIESLLPYKRIAELQYSDFKSVSNFLEPPIFFIYNSNNNSAELITTNITLVVPLKIEYLIVFNGSKWVRLGIVESNNTFFAEPNVSGLSIYIIGKGHILIYLKGTRPYDNQSSYVAAVTQYGNIIYAVQEAPLPKYMFEAFSASSNYSLPRAFPEYVEYYPASSTQYWGLGIPVLQLANSMPNGTSTEGVLLWKQGYNSSKPVSIVIIGTFSNSCFFGGHGFTFYLFLDPDQYQWSISPDYNSSGKFLGFTKGYWIIPGGSGGVIGFPASQEKYIVVSWDPGWATYELELGGVSAPHGNGTWDLFVANNINGVYPQIQTLDLGNGSGLWYPEPGDFIIVNVTYDPTTDMLYGFAYNYNTSQISTFTANLTKLFAPPKSGEYVFGVASGNGWLKANWGIIYINVPFLQHLFSSEVVLIVKEVQEKLF